MAESQKKTPKADPGAQYNPQRIVYHECSKRLEHILEDDFEAVMTKYRSARFVTSLSGTVKTKTFLVFHVDRDEYDAVAEREAAEAEAREKADAAAKAKADLERLEQEAQTLAERRKSLSAEQEKLKAVAA